ncbi:MAG: Hydrolase, alpha/beta fold family [Candidatus Jorgensenbacteria bacterium GW2011_GWB1_50_10]|uniref:Hydrolase, alpha/beta fold family n=2 Tax=Candidatus Joergenseniibacteriota TaxID=1752739 RepID=A0A0G1W9N3_9BACT|nr:MAG: Hydrolase, alpha/beta fold family [Candidatus Jorgensenbacteria bacterium GW2011_GWB1_50_10]
MITTPSFTLATYQKGNIDAPKLALVLPGRLDTKDYVHMRSHVDFFAEKGYLAVSFDPPGTWESPGNIDLFTTTNYIKAVNELIEYFGNKPTVLLGHSRGGSVAILAGASNPTVKAIIAVMATYGPPSAPKPEAIQVGFLLNHRDPPPGDRESKEQKSFKLPLNYFEDGARYSTSAVLKDCQRPTLLIYGTRDEFTKPEKVKEVFETIPGPKQIHELDSDHDYRYNSQAIDEVNKIVERFLNEYSGSPT